MKRLLLVLFIVCFVTTCFGCAKEHNEEGNDRKEAQQDVVKIPSSLNGLKNEEMKKNFMQVCNELDIDATEIKSLKQIEDWMHGIKYQYKYQDETYILYAYESGEIASIRIGNTYGDFLYKNENVIYEDETADIVLNYGELGDYGKEDDFESEIIIRHYIPAGKYTVTSLVKGSMFFIESIEATRNSDGYLETEVFSFVKVVNKGDVAEIEVPEGYCIRLCDGTAISLQKK